jgi:hypothetical protein
MLRRGCGGEGTAGQGIPEEEGEMNKNIVKKILKLLEKKKGELAAKRDELWDLYDELNGILEDLDSGEADIDSGLSLIRDGLETMSNRL